MIPRFELARTPALRSRSWALDVAVAAVVTALAVFGSTGEANPKLNTGSAAFLHRLATHQPGAAYALVVIGGVALVWRRRYPMTVLAVAVGTSAAYSALGYVPGAALSAAYVALFTVATIEARPVAMLAGLGAIVVLFVTSGVGATFGWLGGGNTVMPPFAIAAVALGIAVASRRQVMAAIIERAERAEHDREAEARRRVDAERLRIARELHDVVAHSMSMINVQAGVAAHVLPTRPEQAAEALAAIKAASREGLQELRAILNVMRQVDDERGTSPAPGLAQLGALAAATTQAGVATTVRIVRRRGAPARGAATVGAVGPAAAGAPAMNASHGRPAPDRTEGRLLHGPRGTPAGRSDEEPALPPALELAAYRIVQESLTNVLRHAGPSAQAEVIVVVGRRRVLVQVDDDGRGGAGAGAAPSGRIHAFREGTGTGLAGIRERAATFGGKVSARPRRDGAGWRVRAVLPISAGEQS